MSVRLVVQILQHKMYKKKVRNFHPLLHNSMYRFTDGPMYQLFASLKLPPNRPSPNRPIFVGTLP
jgi:hypothetical protein